MGFLKKFKSMLENKNRKKLIENTIIIVIIGIIIIIVGGSFFKKNNTSNSQTNVQSPIATETFKNITPEVSDLEKRLKAILSQMDGVGNVDVMITYAAGKESVPAYDIKKNESSTNEKDSGGGTRNITQNDYESSVVYEDQNGGKAPVILKEIQPTVKGVVVVTDGASNPQVREEVIKAVQVLMDVPVHKVQVVSRKK